MNPHDSAPPRLFRRFLVAISFLAPITASSVGCDAANQPDRSLRTDLAAIHSLHASPEAIGALDATAPPANLNDYRKPVYRTVSAH